MPINEFSTGINRGQSNIYLYPPNAPRVSIPFHPPYVSNDLNTFSDFESELLDQREKAGRKMLNTANLNLLNPFSKETKFYDQITPDEQLKEIIRNQYMDLKQKEKILKNVPDRLKGIFKKIFEQGGFSEKPEAFDSLINYYANTGIINENDARDIKRIIQNNIIFRSELKESSLREMRELEALKAQFRAEFGNIRDFERIFNRAVLSSRSFEDIPTSRRELVRILRQAILREIQQTQAEETSGPIPANMAEASEDFREEEEEEEFDWEAPINSNRQTARAATAPIFNRYDEIIPFGGAQRGASSRDRQLEIILTPRAQRIFTPSPLTGQLLTEPEPERRIILTPKAPRIIEDVEPEPVFTSAAAAAVALPRRRTDLLGLLPPVLQDRILEYRQEIEERGRRYGLQERLIEIGTINRDLAGRGIGVAVEPSGRLIRIQQTQGRRALQLEDL